jgi:hypothetical protein
MDHKNPLPQITITNNKIFFIFYYLDTVFDLNIVGVVHTGSTRHCGHSWPIVPAPGDCEDREVGGMNGFGRGN